MEEEELWEIVSIQPQGSVVSTSEIANTEVMSDAGTIQSLRLSDMSETPVQRIQEIELLVVLRGIPTRHLTFEVGRRLLGATALVVRGILWILSLIAGVVIHLLGVLREQTRMSLGDQERG